ncbi:MULTISPECIES: helix-turn-helix transcriptional regulator [unclassified Streptomyces]|uniref:helix-turn-helix transcriptional regulator n=1 Tax=unclassified Streptomyces TaxID=2593676 RepID=UPI0022510579|nr:MULTISPECIES: response regulator transcription factor [unclassified Streptomyces]WSP56362.1 response regulator transcription factor [Streptomyces sp. NBC_01241]WSU22921.1 response regulator transcription factor [Streptomyces sp. NBC_01108]MCX4796149.1 response regulator transcription factor [Streptomyces sp. NBC_01242]WSJ37406.1 response regulator transcription factor [Streptomyces sp. NBC_01321]WSP63803.1 response regulator transcription factor [Streptomyces sp. NBC_01240]
MERTTVALRAQDPISQAGVASQLRARPEVSVTDWDEGDSSPQIVVVVVDAVDDEVLTMLRHIQRTSTSRTVLVTTDIDEQKLVSAAECGVAGVVRRSESTPEHLVQVIRTVARGEGHLPSDLLGRLLEEVGRLQNQVLGPRGLHFTGLAAREVDVLRLVAEGYDTADIATKLAYSERTIKNVLHSVMTRLQLRNRSHAVAYAMRQGLI